MNENNDIKPTPNQPQSDLVILKTATNYLLPLLLLFSIFILIRGHYQSGGGFVGGLIASIAFVLHSFAHNTAATKYLLRFSPYMLIPVGLLLSVTSALIPILMGSNFMTALWFKEGIEIISSVGTAMFFDLGVYLVVIGVVLTILFTIRENI